MSRSQGQAVEVNVAVAEVGTQQEWVACLASLWWKKCVLQAMSLA